MYVYKKVRLSVLWGCRRRLQAFTTKQGVRTLSVVAIQSSGISASLCGWVEITHRPGVMKRDFSRPGTFSHIESRYSHGGETRHPGHPIDSRWCCRWLGTTRVPTTCPSSRSKHLVRQLPSSQSTTSVPIPALGQLANDQTIELLVVRRLLNSNKFWSHGPVERLECCSQCPAGA